MKHIKRTIKGVNKTYTVYTKDEFRNEYPDKPLIPWADATQPDQFVLTDDEFVCQVIRVLGPYKAGGSLQLVLPFCRVWTSRTKTLNFEEYYGNGHYSASNPGTWLDSEMTKTRTKRVLRLYAMILMKKGKVTRKDQLKLAKLYRPDQKEPIATFKRMLKQPKVKQQITMELEKLLNEQDITMKSVIEQYKETYNTAKGAEHTNTMKSVTDRFAEMLGMLNKGAQSTQKQLESAEDAGQEEIFGIMQQSEQFIEQPDDSQYIDELTEVEQSP